MAADDRKYFPLIPGTVLTYRNESRDGESHSRVEVVALERRDDKAIAQCRNRVTEGSTESEHPFTVTRTARGVYSMGELDVPFPLKVGQTWVYRGDRYTVDSLDSDAEVRTGKVWRCLKMVHEIASSEAGFSFRYYAPWVGLVREDMRSDESWRRELIAHHVPFEIFVSHASEDNDAIARPVGEALRGRGFHVWYDEFNLQLGATFETALPAAIEDSVCGVAILSPTFLTKQWPRRELAALGARLSFAVLHRVTGKRAGPRSATWLTSHMKPANEVWIRLWRPLLPRSRTELPRKRISGRRCRAVASG